LQLFLSFTHSDLRGEENFSLSIERESYASEIFMLES
jgi:hypothetical protein